MNRIVLCAILLGLLALTNIGMDSVMTHHALDMGFYETNPFTNSVGLLVHAVVLSLIVFGVMSLSLTHGIWLTLLVAFNIVWTLNNMYSVWLLWLV